MLKYNMEAFLRDAVDKYLVLAPSAKLRFVATPHMEDLDPTDTTTAAGVLGGGSTSKSSAPSKEPTGELKNVAASILMKLLYAARMCRYDLLQPIGRLACMITRWDTHCDRMLHRLMCYVQSTFHLRKVGWVGESAATIGVRLYADADFAGCKRSGRSTSGGFLCMGGIDAFFPLQAVSRKQTCVSHGTPEAELVAADMALRAIGIDCLSLWNTLPGRSALRLLHEDNAAMIQVCRTGRNPTMRLMRWLREIFQEPCME